MPVKRRWNLTSPSVSPPCWSWMQDCFLYAVHTDTKGKACWLVSSITRQYGWCCLSFLSMSLLAGLFGRTNSRTSGNDVLRELHRLTRYQLRWHWCGRHGGRGKLVSTRTYLQILGTSTDYSSPSVLLFTDSYRWLSFLFIYLFFESNFKIPPFLVICMLSREPSILKVSVHFFMPLQSPTLLRYLR